MTGMLLLVGEERQGRECISKNRTKFVWNGKAFLNYDSCKDFQDFWGEDGCR